jgi:hypothetical protein
MEKKSRLLKIFSVITILICVGIALAPVQPTTASLMFTNAQAFTGTEGISKLYFATNYPDGSSVGLTLLRADFSSGLSVPINVYLVSLTIYSNVSATRYTATPTANTWYNVTLTAPNTVVAYSTQYKVDSAYAYYNNGTLIGTGYSALADYYMVAKTFTMQKTLTVGTWILDISLYLL